MPPAPVNHIGLTVPDIFGAIDFYTELFGFRLIMGPRILEPSAATPELREIFGAELARGYQAHLLAGNGVGLELFQFVAPPVEPAEPRMRYTRRGVFHLCLTVDDVAGTLARVEAAGGARLNAPYEFVPGRPYRLSYCRDPWGTVIELISHPYAEVFGGWPQPGMRHATRILERDGAEHTLPPRPA
jgi:catechol 2,3-dioxygenase-like lactoylglutathione lyase family enzyme